MLITILRKKKEENSSMLCLAHMASAAPALAACQYCLARVLTRSVLQGQGVGRHPELERDAERW